MVRQQLEGYGGEQRYEALLRIGYLKRPVGYIADIGVALRHDGYNPAFTRLYLLHIADYLVVFTLPGGYHDHREFVIYQGNGAVLHLGCRIALGVNIGYLLEFQGSFQGYRIIVSASHIDEIVGISEHCSYPGYLLVMLEYLLYLVGNPLLARLRARSERAATWAVNALVEATPISGPA